MSASANPLLQQFIPEARDLLEQAGHNLLALERTPDVAEPMNALFRAVHTLKGTSGLFDIGPLTRVVHAAEDLLCTVQSGELALGAATADVLLQALDQVGAWIDGLADAGELPATAELDSCAWVKQLRAELPAAHGAGIGQAADAASAAVPAWVLALPLVDVQACAARPGEDAAELIAISYLPDENCFFRGEDPLALMRQIEGMRLLRVSPTRPWPGLDDIDPFQCNLCLQAIVTAPMAEIEHLFRYVPDQIEIAPLPADWQAGRAAASAPAMQAIETQVPVTNLLAPDDAATVQAVLEGQMRLLAASGDDALWPGRLAAATRALHGVIHFAGRDDLLAPLQAAVARAQSEDVASALLAFIDSLPARGLAGPLRGRRGQTSETIPQRDTPAPEARAVATSTLRVEQGKIDALMNLIGELVVAKNALAYLARRADDGTLGMRELAREIKDRQALVNRIAEEMQAAVMAVRMLPVEHVFQRFPRLVRDIARRLNKRVELVIEGGETEADKNVVEALADPMIHMVRNSLDHGIESPEERRQAGKPEHGTIRLLALQGNDNVIIRIVDDGRGIDAAVVRRKAVDKGLLDQERAAALTDEEAIQLVFAPGFSTAAAVSELSGRGVGMDVVRNAVEKAGGRVCLSSRAGHGTQVELTLPLSMSVTRIMTIAFGDRLFGVPMALVVETVRVPRTAVHRVRNREMFVLRDSVVPVVRLARLLDLPDETDVEEAAMLVVRLNGQRVGIVVGAFGEGMEVIVKPMEGVLAGLRGFSGTTLLGDGRVLLILDVRELVGQ